MRKQIKEEIRVFVSKLKIMDIESLCDPVELPIRVRKAKDIRDLYRAALAALQYTVMTPSHQPVLGSYPNFSALCKEAGLTKELSPSLRMNRNTVAVISELTNLWDASTFADAKKYADSLLRAVTAEMHHDTADGLFRLGRKNDTLSISAAPSIDDWAWEDQFTFFNLLKTALSVSWKILGHEADGIIQEEIDTQRYGHGRCPVCPFMKLAADLLWQMEAFAPAATLYKNALIEYRELKAEDVLDAYLCWGLCRDEEGNFEEARDIYRKAIRKHIEPKLSSPKSQTWTTYASFIYSDLAYLCGTAADRERSGSLRQKQLREEARTSIDKALTLNSAFSKAHCTSATLYYDCGEPDKALAAYERYRKMDLSTEDKLMAVRACIEIRLEQLYSASHNALDTDGIEALCNDLKEYAELFESAKTYGSPDQDTLREMEYARTILLNYDFEINEKSSEIGICLLKIYTCAQKIKDSLRYDPAPDPAGRDTPENTGKKARIAYYTTLKNAKYLLERTTSEDKKADQPDEKDPEEWHDAPKTPPQARNRLTMMHVNYMNDPNEGHTLLHALSHAVEDNKKGTRNHVFRNADAAVFRRKLLDEKFVFMKSFTRLIDQLNMWTTYASDRSSGSDSNGCCICIAPETFEMMLDAPQNNSASKQLEKNQDDYHLYRIAYLSDGQLDVPGDRNGQAANIAEIRDHYDNLKELFEELNDLLDQRRKQGESVNMSRIWAGLSRSLSFIAFLFKDASYSAEKELRLLLTRDKDNRGQIQKTGGQPPKLYIMPPHQIFVDKIILGPKLISQDQWIPHLQYQLADMWESWPASRGEPRTPKVRKSKISYRD